jgi:hypothetical protein
MHRWNPRQSAETPEAAHVGELITRVVATREVAPRKAVWKELQNFVNEQLWLIWLPTPIATIPLRHRFGNISPTSVNGASTVL